MANNSLKYLYSLTQQLSTKESDLIIANYSQDRQDYPLVSQWNTANANSDTYSDTCTDWKATQLFK